MHTSFLSCVFEFDFDRLERFIMIGCSMYVTQVHPPGEGQMDLPSLSLSLRLCLSTSLAPGLITLTT